MATPVQVTALQFGPLGTDGTRFSIPVDIVDTITDVSTIEQAIIRLRMPEDVDMEVRSAMGFDMAVSNTLKLDFVALLVSTDRNEYLFPRCRIDYGSLAPIEVSFTALTDMSLTDADGGIGCRIIINGSKRPLGEEIKFN